jgi:hypothetical protein
VFGVMKGIRALRDAGIIAVACFVAGTPVATAVGPIAIESISMGDMVISANPDTGEIAEREVLEAYVRQSGELVHIWACGEETKATPDHPYHVMGRGWVAAGKLAAGDLLMALSGDAVAVDDVWTEALDEPVAVYNLQVADFHTYYAGGICVLVHNADYPLDPIDQLQNTIDHIGIEEATNGNPALNTDGSGSTIIPTPGKDHPYNPGIPTEEDGFTPKKKWNGNKVRLRGHYGYPDNAGNIWVPTNPGNAHGGSHWDVQHPDGSHTNVYPK